MLGHRPEYRLGDSDEIEGHVATLRSCTDRLGPGHPETLTAAKTLATAFWLAGYTDQAIGLLDQALDFSAATLGREHPIRVDLLGTLGEILFEQRHLEQAEAIQREVLEYHIRNSGPNHSSSLEAKGDLAAMLYELGQDEEASRFEQEAFDEAQTHLGKTHSITCVLAWNRAISYERRGDLDSARGIIASELVWLLVADPSCLEPDQKTIRNLLERRVNWAGAIAC
jgi:tetratricopeptide (TPR) repeat protein